MAEFVIEYGDALVPKNEGLGIIAPDAASIRIFEAQSIAGSDVRYRFAVIWPLESPEPTEQDGNGADE